MSQEKYHAVMFDLLTALLDSWSLWIEVVGSEVVGVAWRTRYLALTYQAGAYRSYEGIIKEAAREVGVPAGRAHELIQRWGGLEPWPETRPLPPGAAAAAMRPDVRALCCRVCCRRVRGLCRWDARLLAQSQTPESGGGPCAATVCLGLFMARLETGVKDRGGGGKSGQAANRGMELTRRSARLMPGVGSRDFVGCRAEGCP